AVAAVLAAGVAAALVDLAAAPAGADRRVADMRVGTDCPSVIDFDAVGQSSYVSVRRSLTGDQGYLPLRVTVNARHREANTNTRPLDGVSLSRIAYFFPDYR